jgi:ABC-type transport system involved in multi-copper enzyme maturation permease subunit
MKALLWKDTRVNSVILAYAMATSVGVFIALAAVNKITEWHTGYLFKEWPDLFGLAAMLSLALELATAVLLGGCAFASERADRTAEFMAYMPVSRRQIVLSKTILVLTVFAFIGLFNVGAILYQGARRSTAMGETVNDMGSVWQSIGTLGALALCMFGCAWFVSSISRSHGLSAAMGILVPLGCVGFMLSLTKLMDWPEDWLDRWIPMVCATLGTLGFVAGVRYYLWRIEP